MKLVEAHEASEDFLESLPGEDSSRVLDEIHRIAPSDEKSGDRIGRYRLLERIGEGSWGAVWLAEQVEDVERRVALKILKLGLDTKEFLARFEAERQMLAMMDHPNIARMLDAGATSYGRPYFVMELVRGSPILEYADREKLDIEQRVELFIQVCQAVQHAHGKGIIHRDLKPSNILVAVHDDQPVVKVIDFGIAKTTQFRVADKTLFTAFHTFMGTPVYSSPEQVAGAGREVDHRSDIYSLGAVLYELLCGQTIIDVSGFQDLPMEAVRKRILEKEPVRASSRFVSLPDAAKAEVSGQRGMTEARLIAQIRGDLDLIVAKCLEKDRTRRYESASALIQDLRNFLESKPVAAMAPSPVYRIRKFITRKRPAYAVWLEVSLAVVVLLAIFAFLRPRSSSSSFKNRSATSEIIDRSVAVLPLANMSSEPENGFFAAGVSEDILTSLSRIKQLFVISRTSTLDYADTNKSLAQIGAELGVRYLVQGSVQRSGGQVRIRAQLVDAQTSSPLWADTFTRALTAENVFAIQSEIAEAIVGALQVVLTPNEHDQLNKFPTENLQALEAFFKANIAWEKASGVGFEEAITHLEEAIALDPDFARAYAFLANAHLVQIYYSGLSVQEQSNKAEPLIEKAIQLDDRNGEAYVALGALKEYQGKFDEAEKAFLKGIDLSPNYARAYSAYGHLLHWNLSRMEEAVSVFRKAVELDPNNAGIESELAEALTAVYAFEEAQAILEKLVEKHPDFASGYHKLGAIYRDVHLRFDLAVKYYRQAHALDPDNPHIPASLIWTYQQMGDLEKALFWARRAYQLSSNDIDRAYFAGLSKEFQGDLPGAMTLFGQTDRSLIYYGYVIYMQMQYCYDTGQYDSGLEYVRGVFPGIFEPEPKLNKWNFGVALGTAATYLKLGQVERAHKIIRMAQALHAGMERTGLNGYFWDPASAHELLGERKEALEELREFVDQGGASQYLLDEPLLATMKGDPEYERLMSRVRDRLAKQRKNVARMEAAGELAPLPVLQTVE